MDYQVQPGPTPELIGRTKTLQTATAAKQATAVMENDAMGDDLHPPAPPVSAQRPNALLSMMATSGKGAVLAHVIKDGYLLGLITIGPQYSKDGNWRVTCNGCKKLISTGEGRTQNVLIHLARTHLESLSTLVLREVIKSLLTQQEKPEDTRQITPTVKRSSSSFAEITPQALLRALAEWIIADGLPFNALEGRGFHQLMTLLRPDINYPGRHTVLKELAVLAHELEGTLTQALKTAVAISITLDMWTGHDVNRSGFMAVDVTYITSNLRFLSAVLAMEWVPGSHDGPITAKTLATVLNRYQIQASQIGAITTDDGSAMAPGIKEFFKEFKLPGQLGGSSLVVKQRHLLCWGHKINNVWKDCSKEIKVLRISLSNFFYIYYTK